MKEELCNSLISSLWNFLLYGIQSVRKKHSKVSIEDRVGQKILFLDSKCLSAIFLAFIKYFLPKKGEIKICQNQQIY